MDHEDGWPEAFVHVVDANAVNFLIIFLEQGLETLSHGNAFLRETFQFARTTVLGINVKGRSTRANLQYPEEFSQRLRPWMS